MNQTSEEPRSRSALILTDGPVPDLVVGGISLFDRWQRGFETHGCDVSLVPRAELAQREKGATASQLLCLADWVMDMMGHEAVADQLDGCAADEVIAFKCDDYGTAPSLCLGSKASAELQAMGTLDFSDGMDSLIKQFGATEIKIRWVELPGKFWAHIADEQAAKAATWAMLKLLQWRPGGVVAKRLNRPISIRLSRLLLNTWVTPNQTTWFGFVVGIFGIIGVFWAEYWSILAGGFLLQLNSVLDGIDGELARMRHQTSSYGAYLDSVCDEILNAALFVAMGYVLNKNGGWIDLPGSAYLYVGIFVGTVSFSYSLAHWHCKIKHGMGLYWWFEAYKPRKEVQRSTSWFAYFKKLFWKESYLMLFFMATIFSVFEALFWMAAPASLAVFCLLFIHVFVMRARW